MRHPEKKQNQTILLWLVLSLIGHFAVFLFRFSYTPTVAEKKQALEFIGQEELEQIKKRIAASAVVQKQQIVNTEHDGKKAPPERARFLGEKDHRVERETIAKKIDSFNTAGKGNSQKESEKSKSPKKAPVTQKGPPPKISLSDLGVGSTNFAAQPESSSEEEKKSGSENGNPFSRGVASNNDYISDIPLGDKTSLNTVEFKYFGFYNRIRQKLEQYWGKSLREKAKNLYEKGRKLANEEDYITSVKLTLDERGNIVHIKILGGSGIQELDDAAIESFNKAGPFPNPPSGMLKDGITTIEWGFVVRS